MDILELLESAGNSYLNQVYIQYTKISVDPAIHTTKAVTQLYTANDKVYQVVLVSVHVYLRLVV